MRVRSGKAPIPVELIVAHTALGEMVEGPVEWIRDRAAIREILGQLGPRLAGIAQQHPSGRDDGRASGSGARSL